MKRLLLLALISTAAWAQGVRVDVPLLTSGPYVPASGGALPQTLFLANASVSICTHPAANIGACSKITTYTDVTLTTPCPANAQLVQLPGSACVSSTGPRANLGFWYAGGVVDYFVQSTYGLFGPFTTSGGTTGPPGSVGPAGPPGPTGGAANISGQANGVIPLATSVNTIAAQSHLDDGITTPNIITASRGVYASVNKVISVLAYGAKCDGTTDDVTAIQNAFNDALSNGASVQFPAGTCLTSTIVWKGQNFFGAGKGITIIKGKPGQDVFQFPDAPGLVPQNFLIRDLTINVDVSVNAAATAAGGNNTFPNRVAGTLQGLTPFTRPIAAGAPVFGQGQCNSFGATGTGGTNAISFSCTNFPISYAIGDLDPALVIGAPITIVGAGSAGGLYTGTIASIVTGCVGQATCNITVSPNISTGVTNAEGSFLNAPTPPWYIGNAGFALACSNGNTCAGNVQFGTFRNLEFNQVGNTNNYVYMSHCAAIFTQTGMYGVVFENIDTNYLYGGYIEAAPFSGKRPTGDTSSFKDMQLHDLLPLVTYNGNDRTFTGINIYQEIPLDLGPFFLTFNQTSSGNATYSINKIYMEGGPQTSGEYARFQSGPFTVQSANFGGGNPSPAAGDPPLAYVEWNSWGGNWTGTLAAGLQIDGNQNTFLNTQLTTALITDNGQANVIHNNSQQSGQTSYQARRFSPSPRPYLDPVGKLDGSALISGNSTTLYQNASDIGTSCEDWAMPNNTANVAIATCVNDPTGAEITKSYMRSATPTGTIDFFSQNGGTAVNIWNGYPRLIGQSIPLTKANVVVTARCVGAATCSETTVLKSYNGTTPMTTFTTTAQSFTNVFTTQIIKAVDFSTGNVGDTLDLRFQGWSNAGTNYDIAYVGIAPLNQDQLSGLAITKISNSLTPAAATASTCVEQTFTYTGLATTMQVAVSPPASLGAHIWIGSARVSTANTLAISFCGDATAGTPPAGSYIAVAW